ncbi:MAG: hypothetical protein ACRD0R_11575 [Acidimicrobiales bacterium]
MCAFPEGHPYARITAVPGLGHRPELWLLGSSDYSAHAAGVLGLPFSFAHHFAAANTLPAVQVYRAAFRPSDDLAEPYLMLGVSVVCAETDEQARWLAGPGRLAFLRLPTVRARLAELAERTGADELIVTTLTHATTDRLASYRLVAGVAGLDRAGRDDAVALTDATT